MTRPVRIGAVRYLNSKPLIYRLDELAPDAELVLDVPSRLAPASTIFHASAAERIPPDAFTPMSAPTSERRSATAWCALPRGSHPLATDTR